MTIIVSVGVLCFVLGAFFGMRAADARDRHKHTRPLRRPYEAPPSAEQWPREIYWT